MKKMASKWSRFLPFSGSFRFVTSWTSVRTVVSHSPDSRPSAWSATSASETDSCCQPEVAPIASRRRVRPIRSTRLFALSET